MSFLRKLSPFRRAPKVLINPNDDFRQLTFIMHDAKALQSISDRQRRQLSEIRNVLVDSSSNVTSTLAKLKAIEDSAANSVEQFISKASKMKMEELSLDSTAVTTQTSTRSSGMLSIFQTSKELKPSTNSLQLISTNTPKGYPLLPYDNMQLVLRLQLVKEYFSALQGLLERSEISAKSLESSSKLIRLLDAVLLGTSSERIHEHMTLFGPEFFQYTMQTCFYSLYEAEIQALCRHLDKYPLQVKAHQKLLQKNSGSTYLLDSLELNTKLRCILAWMGKDAAPSPSMSSAIADRIMMSHIVLFM